MQLHLENPCASVLIATEYVCIRASACGSPPKLRATMSAFDTYNNPAWRNRVAQKQSDVIAQPPNTRPSIFDMSYDDVELTEEEALELSRLLENRLCRPLQEISEAHVIVD